MGALPVALSVHRFVSTVGADAGFAAIVGLAILVLLHFAQARETSHLRDRADALDANVSELEARLAELADSAQERAAVAVDAAGVSPGLAGVGAGGAAGAGSPRLASAGSGVSPVASLASLELPPAPPAGVAAPALSAATRVIPAGVASRAAATGQPAPVGVASAVPGAVGAAAGVRAGPQAVSVGGGRAGGGPGVGLGGGARAADQAEAVGGGAGAVSTRPSGQRPPGPVVGRPATAAAGAGNGRAANRQASMVRRPDSAYPRLVPPGGRAGAGAAGPRRSPTAPLAAPGVQSGGVGRRLLVALGLLAVAALVAAGLIFAFTRSNHSHASAAADTATSSSSRAHTPVPVNPHSVTVSVLNGTPTTGLAHKTAQQLLSAGFREGIITTAPDQTRSTTVVAYMPGDRRQALAVARALRLRSRDVQPVDSGTRAVACGAAPSCSATVIVTVGADLAAR